MVSLAIVLTPLPPTPMDDGANLRRILLDIDVTPIVDGDEYRRPHPPATLVSPAAASNLRK
jgi:hypothetical protein